LNNETQKKSTDSWHVSTWRKEPVWLGAKFARSKLEFVFHGFSAMGGFFAENRRQGQINFVLECLAETFIYIL